MAFRKAHQLATKQEYRCCGAEKNNCLRKIFRHNNGLITTNEMPHTAQCYIDNGVQEAGTDDVPTDGEMPNVNSELEELVDQMAECCPKRMPAKDIARMAHVAMNDKYKHGWKGYKIKWLTDRVRRTRKKVDGGDALSAVEKDFMSDGEESEMRFNITFIDMGGKGTRSHGKKQRVVGFSHPSLMVYMKPRNVSVCCLMCFSLFFA